MSHDDKPVGGPRPIPTIPDPPTDLPELKKVSSSENPLSERLISKNWKTRNEAYIELNQKMAGEPNTAEIFSQHIHLLYKYICDVHPMGQENSLNLLKTVITKGVIIPISSLTEILTILLEKCISSSRIIIREKSLEIIGLLKNTEMFSSILQILLDSINNSKNTKIIISAIQIICDLLRKFGISACGEISEVCKIIEKQAINSTNPQIKAETMAFYKELNKLVPDKINSIIAHLKPLQQEELKKEFLNPSAKTQSRKSSADNPFSVIILPTQPLEKAESTVITPPTSSDQQPEKGRNSEPPANLLKNSENETPLGSITPYMKWTEKKIKIDEFITSCTVENLKNINLADAVTSLKNILIRENNVLVINACLTAITNLAKICKEEVFFGYAKTLIHTIISHYKDKKTIQAINICLDHIFINEERLTEVFELIKEELYDKSPAIKINLCHWIEEKLSKIQKIPEIIKAISGDTSLFAVLLKIAEENTGEIRDSAYFCIGIAKAISDKANCDKNILLAGLPPVKCEKIIKAAEAAKSKYSIIDSNNSAEPKQCFTDPMEEVKTISPFKNARTSLGRSTKKISESKNNPLRGSMSPLRASNIPMTDIPDFESLVKEAVPEEIIKLLSDPNWKEKVKGLTELKNWIQNNIESAKKLNEQFIQFLNVKLKGFKENNLSLFKELLGILQIIVSFKLKNKYLIDLVIPELIEKIADQKWSDQCISLFVNIIETSGIHIILQKIMYKLSTNSKNPSLIKGAFILLNKLCEQIKPIENTDLKIIIDSTKIYILNPNNTIRSQAQGFYCKIYTIFGEQVKNLLGDLTKETGMKNLINEFSKVQLKSGNSSIQPEITEKVNKEISEKPPLIPPNSTSSPTRINLAAKISQKLLDDLSDINLKKRQDAKDQLEKIIIQSGRISSLGLMPLMIALKNRMSETNKSLLKSFISIIGMLAQAMGCGSKQYAKTILPPLISNLTDKIIRQEIFNILDQYVEASGLDTILPIISQQLQNPALNSDIKNELLKWLILKIKPEIISKNEIYLIINMACLSYFEPILKENSEKLIHVIAKEMSEEKLCQYIIEKFDYDKHTDAKNMIINLIKKQPNNTEVQNEAQITPMNDIQKQVENPIPEPMITIECTEIVLSGIDEKAEREDLDLRVKWSVNESKSDYISRLKTQALRAMNNSFVELMFGANENIKDAVVKILKIENKQNLVKVLDIIFKWISINLNIEEIRPDLVNLLKTLFEFLSNEKYQLKDFEFTAIIQNLLDLLPADIKSELILQMCNLYNPAKIWAILLKSLDTHNLIMKLESLLILLNILQKIGFDKIGSVHDIKFLLKLHDSTRTDLETNEKCEKILVTIYEQQGENIWKMLQILPKPMQEKLKEIFTKSPETMIDTVKNPIKNDEEEKSLRKIEKLPPNEDSLNLSLYLGNLEQENMDKKVEGLVKFNEILEDSKNHQILSNSIDKILDSLSNILNNLLGKTQPSEIPIKYAKHFMTVFLKLCSLKELVQNASDLTVELLLEKLLTNLLKEGIDKLGELNEGEAVMKQINSSILRILENCDPTKVICSLLTLLRKSKNTEATGKLPGLIVKCLLKLTKIMPSLIQILEIQKIILKCHEFLLETPPHPPYLLPHDELGVKTVKTIINELVKMTHESIWEHYAIIETHQRQDKDIKRWIAIILSTLNPTRQSLPATSLTIDVSDTQQIEQTPTKILTTKAADFHKKPIFTLTSKISPNTVLIKPGAITRASNIPNKEDKKPERKNSDSASGTGFLTQRVEKTRSSMYVKSGKNMRTTQGSNSKLPDTQQKNNELRLSSTLGRKRTTGVKK